MLEDTSRVMTKTRELCQVIADDPEFRDLLEQVERFLEDDAARLQFQSVHERGADLQEKQNAGLTLGDSEVQEFEGAREALLENPVAKDFLDAQQSLHRIQSAIGKYVGMTLELGRVPAAHDFESAGGECCGGSGCGCSH